MADFGQKVVERQFVTTVGSRDTRSGATQSGGMLLAAIWLPREGYRGQGRKSPCEPDTSRDEDVISVALLNVSKSHPVLKSWAQNASMSSSRQLRSGQVEFLVNGQRVQADLCLHTTLLDFLRARGLTGSKEGCAEGECGACAVVMVKEQNGRPVFRPVNSCLMFLPMAAGQEIYTVEALAASGELHPVQQAMIAAGGSQCGYCTP